MGCVAEESYLLRIIMFLRIAYGLGNLFHDIRGETSACAQDGPPAVPKTDMDVPPAVPKTDMGVRLMHTRSMLRHRIIQVSTRNRLLLLHFQYILVSMKANLELKSHYVLSIQEQHVLVSSQK